MICTESLGTRRRRFLAVHCTTSSRLTCTQPVAPVRVRVHFVRSLCIYRRAGCTNWVNIVDPIRSASLNWLNFDPVFCAMFSFVCLNNIWFDHFLMPHDAKNNKIGIRTDPKDSTFNQDLLMWILRRRTCNISTVIRDTRWEYFRASKARTRSHHIETRHRRVTRNSSGTRRNPRRPPSTTTAHDQLETRFRSLHDPSLQVNMKFGRVQILVCCEEGLYNLQFCFVGCT